MLLKLAALNVSLPAVATSPKVGAHVATGVPRAMVNVRSRDPAAYIDVAFVEARTTHSPTPLKVKTPVPLSTVQEVLVLLTFEKVTSGEPSALALTASEGDAFAARVVDGSQVITCGARLTLKVTSTAAVL